MSSGGPDLFVVCKHCGSEVSPYITECPYCGQRLRKRAPKIDREGRITESVRHRYPTPGLPRLRPGEIPGIRAESPPYATVVLVLLGVAGCLVWRTSAVALTNLVASGGLHHSWWRALTAPFIYDNTGYAFVGLAIIAIFGSLLERRHGPVVSTTVALLGGVGGVAVTSLVAAGVVLGGNGMALALLCAWAVPDLIELRAKREVDGDMMATGVLAAVMVLMPVADTGASWIAGGVGVGVGLALGCVLARIHQA
ncbi:MAG: rhomboid family intramembrane serine protease [Solirubrobacteraceae bacterium]